MEVGNTHKAAWSNAARQWSVFFTDRCRVHAEMDR